MLEQVRCAEEGQEFLYRLVKALSSGPMPEAHVAVTRSQGSVNLPQAANALAQ